MDQSVSPIKIYDEKNIKIMLTFSFQIKRNFLKIFEKNLDWIVYIYSSRKNFFVNDKK